MIITKNALQIAGVETEFGQPNLSGV